ncbi:MAG: glycerol-3-phosphate dehydrogenase C-terminal domain-containing protein, partial [Pseudomonadota bacterium]
TTHRATAEQAVGKLRALGLDMGPNWTKGVPIYGGTLDRTALLARANDGPASIAIETRHRWAFTYGDRIDELYAQLAKDARLGDEIVPGVPRVELEHAATNEDAKTGDDFLLRRTKLWLFLKPRERATIEDWFAAN